ncbi:NAD(P)/FAD-dependent oxidoreductase [Streptococcus sp. zg-JUN1979]|uniref:NAD(P)/FAD-dependent oxidoreductase n=1 Tax=Streptococcus sp. zg-JUN1979 TaxID=3391450 RepID=UPI0039A4C340
MNIAIIGSGAVGASCAYYLSKESDLEITVFDYGVGQATKAAAGIISPWFSKRRNKAWYTLARLGADFYPLLLADLEADGIANDFYKQTGVLLLKKDESKLDELYELASLRHEESPLMGDLALLDSCQISPLFPDLTGFSKALYASGGARVDGARLTKTLLEASRLEPVKEKVTLEVTETGYRILGKSFDKVILATGAWLGELLTPLGYQVDIRGQKGQLEDYYFEDRVTDDYPVVMPEGEADIIAFDNGKIALGASHENDKGFDLRVDKTVLDGLKEQVAPYFSQWDKASRHKSRVGTRAYTSDFSPFIGQVPGLAHVYAASGLGSTGLTIGPFLGKQLASLLLEQPLDITLENYPIERYIHLDKC